MNSSKNLLFVFLLLIAAGISSSLLAQQKTMHVKVVSNGKNSDSVYTVTYQGGSRGNAHQNYVTVYHNNDGKNAGSRADSIIEVNVVASDNEGEDITEDGNVVVIRHSGGEDETAEIEESDDDFPLVYSCCSTSCIAKCCAGDSSSHKMRKKIHMYIRENGQDNMKHRRMKYVFEGNNGPSEEVEAQMERIPLSVKDTTIMHVSPQGYTIKIHRKILKDGNVDQNITVNKHSRDTASSNFFSYRVRPGRNRMYFRNMGPRYHGEENFDFIMPPMPPLPPGEEMNFDFPGMAEGIDVNADFGKIKVTPLLGKNAVRISLDLSGKETTVIKISDEKGKSVFEEKVKDLTGKYVRDIDMTGNANGKYSLGIERGKSSLTKSFSY
jgi:hypothetical protein